MHPDCTAKNSLIPPETITAEARAFSYRIHDLLDGTPKDEATVELALEGMEEMLDRVAARLYNLAAMLVGEGEEAERLVEMAITDAEVSICRSPALARRNGRRALGIAALELLAKRNPAAFIPPDAPPPCKPCLKDEEMEAAGISYEEFETLVGGPARGRVREWLNQLPTAQRVVFVLRAVAGLTTEETARQLRDHGGAAASGWSEDKVRESFRQGLCSLASQLLHARARVAH